MNDELLATHLRDRVEQLEEAKRREAELCWQVVHQVNRGWRRVVASPQPLKVIQWETIRTTATEGNVVIACGGGGIPVTKGEDGNYSGVLGEVAAFLGRLGVEAVQGGGAKVYYREHQGARYFDYKALRATAPLDPLLVNEALLSVLTNKPLRDTLEALKNCRLDLSKFEARRANYKAIRPYFTDEAS